MLNAYRGVWSDLRPVAPEFWYFVPAKVLGVNMVTFEREVPLWQAHRQTFKHYNTEGWSITWPERPNPHVESHSTFVRVDEGRYQEHTTVRTRFGTLTSCRQYDVSDPSWIVERPIKDLAQDYDAWLETAFPPIELHDYTPVSYTHLTLPTIYSV